jgi:hypothetical protein
LPAQKKIAYEVSPGELYKGITAVGESFEGETKLMKERDPDFVLFCKQMHARFPGLGKGAVFTQKHREAIDFLGWKLSAEEFMSAIKGVAIMGAIPAVIILVIIYLFGFGLEIGKNRLIETAFLTEFFTDFALPVYFIIAIFLFAIIGIIVYLIYKYPLEWLMMKKARLLLMFPKWSVT